jgi:hypothetical protein
MPKQTEDDVLQFMLDEAMAVKINEHREKLQKDSEKKSFRGDHRKMAQTPGGRGGLR